MKKIFLVMICLILFIFTISSVSATDANQTENILTTDIGTFSELHDTINNAENGSTVNLDKDYVYNGGDGGEGINITKDIQSTVMVTSLMEITLQEFSALTMQMLF